MVVTLGAGAGAGTRVPHWSHGHGTQQTHIIIKIVLYNVQQDATEHLDISNCHCSKNTYSKHSNKKEPKPKSINAHLWTF